MQRGSCWGIVDSSSGLTIASCIIRIQELSLIQLGNIFRITMLIRLSAPVSSARQGIGSRKRQVTACSCSAEGDRYIVIFFRRALSPMVKPPLSSSFVLTHLGISILVSHFSLPPPQRQSPRAVILGPLTISVGHCTGSRKTFPSHHQTPTTTNTRPHQHQTPPGNLAASKLS